MYALTRTSMSAHSQIRKHAYIWAASVKIQSGDIWTAVIAFCGEGQMKVCEWVWGCAFSAQNCCVGVVMDGSRKREEKKESSNRPRRTSIKSLQRCGLQVQQIQIQSGQFFLFFFNEFFFYRCKIWLKLWRFAFWLQYLLSPMILFVCKWVLVKSHNKGTYLHVLSAWTAASIMWTTVHENTVYFDLQHRL